MPIPQVNDRIKEAPAVMLRAVFAGIGQLLLAADKVRARAAEQVWPPDRAATHGQASSRPGGQSLDKTRIETVRRDAPPSETFSAERKAAANPGTVTAGSGSTAPAKDDRPSEPPPSTEPAAGAGAASAAPPLPGYDDLSLPSLRARLRTMDAEALRAALAYERAHAHRDDVITMFERRLTKITAG